MTDNPFKAPAEPPMTFRDHCAIAAMQGLLAADARYDESTTRRDKLARDAYAHADAIIEARDARRGAQ